jgi:hypothetical protein
MLKLVPLKSLPLQPEVKEEEEVPEVLQEEPEAEVEEEEEQLQIMASQPPDLLYHETHRMETTPITDNYRMALYIDQYMDTLYVTTVGDLATKGKNVQLKQLTERQASQEFITQTGTRQSPTMTRQKQPQQQ